MVDVDRRMAGLTTAHAAGLRRLSARAAASSSLSSSSSSASTSSSSFRRNGLLSFRPLAESVIAHLRACSVPVHPGLSDAEFVRLEAELSFSFPPDLRAVLALGVPAGRGFPDWRCLPSVRASVELPLSAAALQVVRGTLWPRCWGLRPIEHDRGIRLARAALRRAPTLVPLYDRCYIPAYAPSLAGNPVFFVDDARVLCCGFDLADFFQREEHAFRSSHFQTLSPHFSAGDPIKRRHHPHHNGKPPLPLPATTRRSLEEVAGRAPRWIEFWSDAASIRRRRVSSSSSSSSDTASSSSSPRPDPKHFVEIRPLKLPDWVETYLDRIGAVLRNGGWHESDVSDMVHTSAPGGLLGCHDDDAANALVSMALDDDAVLDSLLVKAERCSDSLRRAGWSSDEVSDAMGFDLGGFRGWRLERECRPAVKLPPRIVLKIEKIAGAVTPS